GDRARPSDGEHGKSEIDSDDRTAGKTRAEKHQVPGATTQVEPSGRPFPAIDSQSRRLRLPSPVKPEAHHVVDEVVALGETRKHLAHLRGALLVVRKVLVWHRGDYGVIQK